ncbi:transposase [Paraburkholderia elongata]|uniref:Transposase n=1 Tax=Paraburkholderia elongata TaxID=2675747 RepID=A0A972NJ70_9BURK|nr:transposase [Paraburkholderia elongata]NPT54393.1 transposase [Paraburkholderia elongata]
MHVAPPLSDEDWNRVSHLFPHDTSARFGRPRRHPREIFEAILWVLENREKWHHLPQHYPPQQTCYIKWLQWRRAGIMSQAFALLGIGNLTHDGR